MSENIQEVNETNFKNVVLDSDIPVLVDCWAPWCMPCRAQQTILEKVADELQGKTLITFPPIGISCVGSNCRN